MLARALGGGGWNVEDIGTFNGVAPFLAPVSERLARGVERGEYRTAATIPGTCSTAAGFAAAESTSPDRVGRSRIVENQRFWPFRDRRWGGEQ